MLMFWYSGGKSQTKGESQERAGPMSNQMAHNTASKKTESTTHDHYKLVKKTQAQLT